MHPLIIALVSTLLFIVFLAGAISLGILAFMLSTGMSFEELMRRWKGY